MNNNNMGAENSMNLETTMPVEGMMGMEQTGPVILGFHLDSLLLLISGIFYVACALFVYRSYKKSPTELVGALLAFLVYQAINMFFMGMEIHTMNMIYGNIAAFSVLIGSAYMLKFPFSSFSKGTRRFIFSLSILSVLGIFVWFMQNEMRQMELMNFTLYYDMVVNGIIVGGFMFILALRTAEKWLKVKAFGGSTGVISCCIASNAAMLSGAMITSAIFGFLAPVLILGSLIVAGKKSS